jgi:hypothetical protein
MDYYDSIQKFEHLLEAIVPSQLSKKGASIVGKSMKGHKQTDSKLLAQHKAILNFHTLSPSQKEKVRNELGFGKNTTKDNVGNYKVIRGSMIDPNTLIELFWDYAEDQEQDHPLASKVQNFIYIPQNNIYVSSNGVEDGATHSELQSDSKIQKTIGKQMLAWLYGNEPWKGPDVYHGRIITVPKDVEGDLKDYVGQRIMALWEDVPNDVLEDIIQATQENDITSIHMPKFQ